jgi:hypothetical protein
MLGRKTLFIIGAGAGFDIEMPMGDKLALLIAEYLNIRFEHGSRLGSNDLTAEALRLLAKRDDPRADANPYYRAGRQIFEGLVGWSSSIDGYLNRHQDQPVVQECGKLAIAQIILESENACHLYVEPNASSNNFRDTARVRQSWFQQLWSILETGIIKSKNIESIFDNLHVITFNYDRTLEHFLLMGLQKAYHLPEKEAAAIINAKLNIDHVYGQVADLPWQDKGHGFAFGRKPGAQDLVHLWKRITTFNEEISDTQLLTKLTNKVSAAERIVFLGCHFHDQNMKLLRAESPVGNGSVYATGIGRSKAALTTVESQLREMIGPRAINWQVSMSPNWGCKELFREFDTQWSRG